MPKAVDSQFMPGCSVHSKRLNESDTDGNAQKAQHNMPSDCWRLHVLSIKKGERQELKKERKRGRKGGEKGKKGKDRTCENWVQ